MSIKFLVLGGGGNWGFWGGKCRFYFYGRGDFSEQNLEKKEKCLIWKLVMFAVFVKTPILQGTKARFTKSILFATLTMGGGVLQRGGFPHSFLKHRKTFSGLLLWGVSHNYRAIWGHEGEGSTTHWK